MRPCWIAAIALVGVLATSGLAPADPPNEDPLSARARWRDVVMGGPLSPPAVTAKSPLLVIVSGTADLSHPELSSGNVRNLTDTPITFPDGTSSASIASAPANGQGIVGIWPGMRVALAPLPSSEDISCDQVVDALHLALDARPAVIALGYGFSAGGGPPGTACGGQFAMTQEAVRRGVLVVASGPMRRSDGGLTAEPATLPHVLSVAPAGRDETAASFTRESATTDVTAPGVGILAAVPRALDADGDGYGAVTGTGPAAAMVAAAAAWLLAARPSLEADQVAGVLRSSARDLEDPGWDSWTGWGMLNVAAALAQRATPEDPLEPNEDVRWIDGSVLDGAQRALTPGRTVAARLDHFEDPDDVYRLRLRAGAAARVRVRPLSGDPALSAHDARASSVRERRHRLGRSDRRGRRTETLRVRNTARRTRTLFVHVSLSRRDEADTAAYRLSLSRVRG